MSIFVTKKFLAEREIVYMLIDKVLVECEWMWNLRILYRFTNHNNTQEKFENNVRYTWSTNVAKDWAKLEMVKKNLPSCFVCS